MTASNEAQATAYRNQIENRLEKGLLPEETTYAVLPDPEGKRVGSGGATFQVMRYIADQEPERENPFKNRRILVIHSGGDSSAAVFCNRQAFLTGSKRIAGWKKFHFI